MDRKAKNTIIISIIALALVLITVTYAYFAANISGIESASTISLNAGTMSINYTEGNSNITTAPNMYPRSEAWITKEFTLTGNNNTALPMEYQVGIEITNNTFYGAQLSYSLEVGQNNDGTSMPAVNYKPIVGSNHTILIGKGSFPANTSNGTQTYTLKIYFLDNGKNQNINQGASFSGNLIITEKGGIIAVNDCIDEAHPSLTQGATYVNGQYTYKYMQRKTNGGAWANITDDGWGVDLTDKNSTDPVTTPLCTSINGKPIVSMSSMFKNSHATSLDLSSFDTSNVTDMSNMFSENSTTSLDVSIFDTSNVTNMNSMFSQSQFASIDLSNFDTSNVTDMSGMFYWSNLTDLDVRNFNTSNVTDMSNMFNAYFDSLNVSSFDTSSVTNMSSMFETCIIDNLDLSSFDTSNVTNMSAMFINGGFATLDLSSFDTSSVTDMSYMFSSTSITTAYARTQSDANRFNNVAGSLSNGNNPNTYLHNATFVVK